MANERVEVFLRNFRLPTMAAIWRESVTRAEREDWGSHYHQLLQHHTPGRGWDSNISHAWASVGCCRAFLQNVVSINHWRRVPELAF